MKKTWIAKFDGTEYAFLSNFYECQCGFEGWEYTTSEHAYQAAKTLDLEKRAMIQKLATPGASKRMGRKVELREDWEEIKDDVMLTVLRSKFKNNEDLREKLLATGDAVLIEGNVWHDNYWGICSCEKCGGVGKNMLGTLLMKVRAEFASVASLIANSERADPVDYLIKQCPACLGELIQQDGSWICLPCDKVWDYEEDPYNGA